MKNIQSLEDFLNESSESLNEGAVEVKKIASSIKARKLNLTFDKTPIVLDINQAEELKVILDKYLELFS